MMTQIKRGIFVNRRRLAILWLGSSMLLSSSQNFGLAIEGRFGISREEGKLLYGERYGSVSHASPPEYFLDTAEPTLLSLLERSKEPDGKPGRETLQMLNNLIDFHLARKQYDQAEKFGLQKMQTCKDIEGTKPDQLAMCMKEIAEIHLLKNDKAKAVDWLNKAEQSNVSNNVSSMVKCAALWLELGDKDAAARLALKASKTFVTPHMMLAGGSADAFSECAYLLTQMGQTQEVERLTKLCSDNTRSRQFGGYGWWEKTTEPRYLFQDGIWVRKTRATMRAEQELQSRAYRVGPRNPGQEKAHQEMMERLQSRLPPHVYRNIEESRTRSELISKRRNEEALKKAETEKANQDQIEKGLHDYATARIIALQQAQADQVEAAAEKKIRDDTAKKRAEDHFQKVAEQFEKSKTLKDSDPKAYLNSMSSLASATYGTGDRQKALELRKEALDYFLSTDPKQDNRDTVDVAFRILREAARAMTATPREQSGAPRETTDDELFSYFAKLTTRIEGERRDGKESLDGPIFEFLRDGFYSRSQAPKIPALYDTWIDARKKARGDRHASLDLLLKRAASANRGKENKKAEQLLLERLKLDVKDKSQIGIRELQLAEFYAHTEQPAEAEKYWRHATKHKEWIQSSEGLNECLRVSEQFKRRGLSKQAKEMLVLTICNPDAQSIGTVDSVLMKRVERAIQGRSYEHAEEIVRLRLLDAKKYTGTDTSWWEQKLEEIVSLRMKADERKYQSTPREKKPAN